MQILIILNWAVFVLYVFSVIRQYFV